MSKMPSIVEWFAQNPPKDTSTSAPRAIPFRSLSAKRVHITFTAKFISSFESGKTQFAHGRDHQIAALDKARMFSVPPYWDL